MPNEGETIQKETMLLSISRGEKITTYQSSVHRIIRNIITANDYLNGITSDVISNVFTKLYI